MISHFQVLITRIWISSTTTSSSTWTTSLSFPKLFWTTRTSFFRYSKDYLTDTADYSTTHQAFNAMKCFSQFWFSHFALSVMYLFLDKYSHGLIQDSYCCYHSRLCHWQQQTQWISLIMTAYFRILVPVTVTSLRVTPKTPKSFSTVMTNHGQALMVIRCTIMPLHCSVRVNHGWTNEAFFSLFFC